MSFWGWGGSDVYSADNQSLAYCEMKCISVLFLGGYTKFRVIFET